VISEFHTPKKNEDKTNRASCSYLVHDPDPGLSAPVLSGEVDALDARVLRQQLGGRRGDVEGGAGAGRVLARRPVHHAVGVGRRLAVAEVGAVAAAADAPGDARLLDRLADEHAVLLELLGEDGVEEGVAARVERQDEHGEHLGLLQRDELQSERRRQREERDRRPAQKVSEHQQRHSLRDSGIVRIPCLATSKNRIRQ
jgi:hypothetical protein